MPERPDVEITDPRLVLLRDRIDTLETRLRAATERCGVRLMVPDSPYIFCSEAPPEHKHPACRSDLTLLDGTPELVENDGS